MQPDLLVKVLNAMPPEQLGRLIAKIQNPQGYINKSPGGPGYRGNLSLQLRQMQGSLGGANAPPRRTF